MDKTIAEQIKDLEATRAAKAAALAGLMQKASKEGRTMDAKEAEEFDTINNEIDQIDKDLSRARIVEKHNLASATAVAAADGTSAANAAAARGTDTRVQIIEPKLEKGIGFARLAGCLAMHKGNAHMAAKQAARMFGNDAKLLSAFKALTDIGNGEMLIKTAVAAGNTTDANYASALVNYQVLASEFIEFLRPMTVIGRIPGLRKVPFNIRVPRQTAGVSAGWVGEGKPKPVGALAFDYVALGYTKLAIIAAITQELDRFSEPSAQLLVRDDLANSIVQQMDNDFLEPTNAGIASVKPASITNGITMIESSGSNDAAIRNDVAALMGQFLANNLNPSSAVWLMHTATALRLSLSVNALGQPNYPGITAQGGTFFGLPVITSSSGGFVSDASPSEHIVALVKANDILLADDGQVTIDTSTEASIQMNTAPDDPTTASTVMVSAFQQNLLFMRAERFINWVRARNASVAVLGNVGWTG